MRGGAGGKKGIRGRFKAGRRGVARGGKEGKSARGGRVKRRGLFDVTKPAIFLCSMAYGHARAEAGGVGWLRMGGGEEGKGEICKWLRLLKGCSIT